MPEDIDIEFAIKTPEDQSRVQALSASVNTLLSQNKVPDTERWYSNYLVNERPLSDLSIAQEVYLKRVTGQAL